MLEQGSVGQPISASAESTAPLYMAVCCLLIILALVLGVGLTSNLVLRHIVLTIPLWIGVVLGFRRSRAAPWAALPLFLFWLILMALIWAYLVGVSNVFSGHYSSIEIAMTIIVGAAALVGIASFTPAKSNLPIAANLSLFAALAGIQWICFLISFLPSIAHR